MEDVEYKWSAIARQMLGAPKPKLMHSDLIKELSAVNTLVQAAGGELWSRQVVAVIIVDWQRRNPEEQAAI